MNRRTHGFTLLEMMVSLVLVSAVMLGLLTAMRTLASSAASVDAVVDRISDMSSVSAFLRTTIRGMEDASVLVSSAETRFERVFIGESGRLRWTGVMPARHAMGGLHVFELELTGGDQAEGGVLYLHYQPYPGGAEPLDRGVRQSHVLIEGVQSIVFSYQSATSDASEWREAWSGVEFERALPRRIRLQLAVADRYWPEIVIPVAPL